MLVESSRARCTHTALRTMKQCTDSFAYISHVCLHTCEDACANANDLYYATEGKQIRSTVPREHELTCLRTTPRRYSLGANIAWRQQTAFRRRRALSTDAHTETSTESPSAEVTRVMVFVPSEVIFPRPGPILLSIKPTLPSCTVLRPSFAWHQRDACWCMLGQDLFRVC